MSPTPATAHATTPNGEPELHARPAGSCAAEGTDWPTDVLETRFSELAEATGAR